jgi:feruloyl esterase
MEHCGGGAGANSFGQGAPSKTDSPRDNVLTTLEQWVESGKTPAQITATKYKDNVSTNGVAFTRLLCPYPQIAKYKGSGDTNNASSFSCEVN